MRVQLLYIVLCVIVLPLVVVGQCPGQWVRQISALPNGNLGGQRLTVVTDVFGNSIASNVIHNATSVETEGQQFSGFNANALNISAYVVKHSPDGTLQWLRVFDGTGLMSILDIAIDDEGAVYVAGYATTSITVGMTQLDGPGAYQPGYFILKFSNMGEVLWHLNTDWPNSRCGELEWTVNGLSFAIAYSDSLRIGDSVFHETASVASNHQDVLMGTLSENGELLNAFNIGGSGDIDVGSMSCNDDVCVIQGKFSGSIEYGGTTIGNTPADLHFALYQLSIANDGQMNWAVQSSNTQALAVYPYGAAISTAGDALFMGEYLYSHITIDDSTIPEPESGSAMYLNTLDSEGNVMAFVKINAGGGGWAKPLDAKGENYWIGVGFDSEQFAFDEFVLDNHEQGTFDGGLFSVGKNGRVRCGIGFHGEGDNSVRAVSVTDDNHVVVLVSINGTLEFGGEVFSAIGNHDLLLVKTCLPCDTLTSITEAGKLGAALALYPNPAKHTVRLQVSGSRFNVQSVVLTDMLGHSVLSLPSGVVGEAELDVSGLSAGVYAVAATLQNGEMLRQRLVVQR